MKAVIRAIEYHLPEKMLSNLQLEAEFPEWTAQKIEKKTGINTRYIAAVNECASDLGIAASRKLFETGICQPQNIDFLIFCTQSPDYFLPTTACLMQERLRIPQSAGALDINLGCSGYIYGLGMAKGLIETSQARNVLFITAETYSKFLHPEDIGVRTIFGDGAAVTLIQGADTLKRVESNWIGPFAYGTDGCGAANLIVEGGGMRYRYPENYEYATDESKINIQPGWGSQYLYMDGPEIFAFTLKAVPGIVDTLLAKAKKSDADIDLYVFHQANGYMLNKIRRKMKIPEEKFYVCLRDFGNTVSATIPIALKNAQLENRLKSGDNVVMVGFGVGYSWASALVRWYE